MTVRFRRDSLDLVRVRGHLDVWFSFFSYLVFRPFSSHDYAFFRSRFRVTVTRCYTSVRACVRLWIRLCVRVSGMYAFLFCESYVYRVCRCACMYGRTVRLYLAYSSSVVLFGDRQIGCFYARSIFGVFSLAVARYPPWG